MKLTLNGGHNVIENMTDSEKKQIKKELTIPNPDYEKAKIYGKGRVFLPPNLFFYKALGTALVVPRGYAPKKCSKVIDSRVEVKVKYPKLKINLRDTQQIAFKEWEKDTSKGLTVLPTGKGKSIYGAYLAYASKQKTLIVVNKTDLVLGWRDDILMMFPELKKNDVGIIKAQKFNIGEQYTLATIQTLAKLPIEKLAELYSTFGMIIVDECHHISANSYNVLNYFRAKYFIGLTATDMLPEGKEPLLEWRFGGLCYRHKEDKNDEDIMPYTVIIKSSDINYNPPPKYTVIKGKKVRKPNSISELRKVIANSQSFNSLVAKDIIKEYHSNKSCVAFFHEKEHIRTMRDLLELRGVNKDQIQLYYGDSNIDDSILKQRAENKDVLITLATYAKATEGTNVKSWERLFLVSSVNNTKNVIQAVGRGRRRKAGKPDVVVYDYTHPNVVSVKSHIYTRLKAYRDTQANIVRKDTQRAKSIFTKGWRKRA